MFTQFARNFDKDQLPIHLAEIWLIIHEEWSINTTSGVEIKKQSAPQEMRGIRALLRFVVVLHWSILPIFFLVYVTDSVTGTKPRNMAKRLTWVDLKLGCYHNTMNTEVMFY